MIIKPAKGLLSVSMDESEVEPASGAVPATVVSTGKKSDYAEGDKILVKNLPWLWTKLGDGSYLIFEDICVLGKL